MVLPFLRGWIRDSRIVIGLCLVNPKLSRYDLIITETLVNVLVLTLCHRSLGVAYSHVFVFY